VIGAERFLTTANRQHPHILPLSDSGQADHVLHYVMPFVRGARREGIDSDPLSGGRSMSNVVSLSLRLSDLAGRLQAFRDIDDSDLNDRDAFQ